MGRPRTFDEQEVSAAAGALFVRFGYAATSIDDLVSALGLHRGSLYKSFGSKRGLFVAALHSHSKKVLPTLAANRQEIITSPVLDLVLVASLELAPRDREVSELVRAACAVLTERFPELGPQGPALLLGQRLLQRADLLSETPRST